MSGRILAAIIYPGEYILEAFAEFRSLSGVAKRRPWRPVAGRALPAGRCVSAPPAATRDTRHNRCIKKAKARCEGGHTGLSGGCRHTWRLGVRLIGMCSSCLLPHYSSRSIDAPLCMRTSYSSRPACLLVQCPRRSHSVDVFGTLARPRANRPRRAVSVEINDAMNNIVPN